MEQHNMKSFKHFSSIMEKKKMELPYSIIHKKGPGGNLSTVLLPNNVTDEQRNVHKWIHLRESVIMEKDDLKGLQQHIGDASESSAALHLIKLHNLTGKHHEDTKKSMEEKIESTKDKLPPDTHGDRVEHGVQMANASSAHLKELYPGYEIESVHLTNKPGDIGRATKGIHNDSSQDNPSDITVGLNHKKTGDKLYHGLSLKSTQGSASIGFKNPTPRTMDKELGTKSQKLWQDGIDELHDHIPDLVGLPAKSDTLVSKKDVLSKWPTNIVKEISHKTHKRVRDGMIETINSHLKNPDGSDNPEGHEKVKKFFTKNYFNTAAATMPYSKVTAHGTRKKGISVSVEVPHETHIVQLMNHPDSRIRVEPRGHGYMHVYVTDPKTGNEHHAFSEQVKTSSGFGYSSPRHNIQPPGKVKDTGEKE